MDPHGHHHHHHRPEAFTNTNPHPYPNPNPNPNPYSYPNPYPPPAHNPYGYPDPPPPYYGGAPPPYYGSAPPPPPVQHASPEYGYATPPPRHVHHVSHEGCGYEHQMPPPPPPECLPHVEHVRHECGPHGRELPRQPTVRVYTMADENFSLSIREGSVVLVPSNPRDDYQVRLAPYNPDYLDESLLWAESKDTGGGFRCIRMVNNIRLNFDAFHGDEDHGGVRDGTPVVLWEWLKGKNQRWKIVPY